MLNTLEISDGQVAEYWRTYFEWRIAYGLTDGCMEELLAAVRVALERTNTSEHRNGLERLIKLIETERRLAELAA